MTTTKLRRTKQGMYGIGVGNACPGILSGHAYLGVLLNDAATMLYAYDYADGQLGPLRRSRDVSALGSSAGHRVDYVWLVTDELPEQVLVTQLREELQTNYIATWNISTGAWATHERPPWGSGYSKPAVIGARIYWARHRSGSNPVDDDPEYPEGVYGTELWSLPVGATDLDTPTLEASMLNDQIHLGGGWSQTLYPLPDGRLALLLNPGTPAGSAAANHYLAIFPDAPFAVNLGAGFVGGLSDNSLAAAWLGDDVLAYLYNPNNGLEIPPYALGSGGTQQVFATGDPQWVANGGVVRQSPGGEHLVLHQGGSLLTRLEMPASLPMATPAGCPLPAVEIEATPQGTPHSFIPVA